MSASRPPSETPGAIAGRLAAFVTGAAVCLRATVDPDLWGHLRFGLDVLHGAGLPSVDPYSFTQDVPWINHEWLSEAIFAAAYRIGGVPGLILLKAAILAAAMGLLAAVARHVDAEYRGWLLAVTFLNLAPIATAFRPHLWTILGVALVCWLLARERFAWMPIVFAVWANLHGGWIVGGSVLTLWLVGRALDRRSVDGSLRPLLIFAVAALATLLTPYGWHLWTFLAATVRMSRTDITEWQPYWVAFEVQHGVLLPLALGVFVTTLLTQWRQLTWARILPAVWLAINGVAVGRTAPLFAEVGLWCAATAWRRPVTASTAVVAPPMRGRWIIDVMAASIVVLPTLWTNVHCLEIAGDWAPDLVAAGALDDPHIAGRLVVPFNWGEYAIWHWGPRLRVSMDGRRETVYSNATVAEQLAVSQGNPGGLAFLDRVRPEYVWLPGDSSAAAPQWLSTHGYVVDVQTDRSFVARRADLAAPRPSVPRAACFP